MAHYLLRYTVANDYLERRPAFRAAHLAYARAAVARGELLLGGALEASPVPPEPVEGLPFRSADEGKDSASTSSARTVVGSARTVVGEALLLFAAESPTVADEFARSDPYVTNGLVTAWRVDRWLTVVGADAAETVTA